MRGKVPIEIDESLSGATVRVYYQPDVHIKVGRNATELDIQLHIGTVRTLRRYAGLTGKVRALLERIYNWIKRNGEPPVGSKAWEAKLELEKLPNIIAERQARLAAGDLDSGVRADLEAEIGDLEEQIDYHARNLEAMDVNPGVGYVASEGYVELHNHLGGVLEPDELLSINYSIKGEDGTERIDYKKFLSDLKDAPDLAQIHQDYLQTVFKGIDIENLNQEQAQSISHQLLTSESVNGQKGTRYNSVYAYRRINSIFEAEKIELVRGELIKKLVKKENMLVFYQKVIEKLKSQGIDYIELQGSIRNGRGYYFTEDEIVKILGKTGIDVRFLRSLQSGLLSEAGGKRSAKKIEQAVDRLKVEDNVREVGVDILGRESIFHPEGMKRFETLYETLLDKAKSLGRPLVLRIHVGEGYVRRGGDHVSEARDNVSILTQKLKQMQGEGKLDPEMVIIRYGHATHASFKDLEEIKKLGVIVEANLRSNVTTGSVSNDDETQQTLLKFLYHDINTILNTDGGGVMGTNLPREYKLAREGIELFKINEIGIPDPKNKTIYYYDEIPDLEGLEEKDYPYLKYEHRLIPSEKKANFEFEKLKENSDYYRDNIAPRITGEKQ